MAIWKKALLFFLCAVMALSLVACGGEEAETDKNDSKEESSKEETLNPGDENCEHQFTQWQVERTRTCEKDGKKSRECELCGKEEVMVWVATGHEFYGRGECSVCGKREPSCKHKKAETVIIDEPTCEESGEKRSICKSCKSVLKSEYLSALGHEWIEHEAQEPTCTEIGWYTYSECGRCDYNSYEEREAYGHDYFAGVCERCGESDGETQSVTMEGYTKVEYVAATGEKKTVVADAAEIIVTTGTVDEGGIATYTMTPANAGVYRVWISELYSGNVLRLYVKNHLGEEVARNTYCTNGEGLTVTLEAGVEYTLEVQQYRGTGITYQLNAGCQTAVLDLSEYSVWSGSFEFVDQVFGFTYTPVNNGDHTFTVGNMMSGTYSQLYIYNRLGETVAESNYLSNGRGVSGYLTAGETYTIAFKYQNKLSTVELTIGKPKAAVDVSAYNVIKDSLEYNKQTNLYTFVAQSSNYTFVCAGAKDNNVDMRFEVLNRLEESVCSTNYFSNGDRVTAENLVVGETYTIRVGYYDDATPYEVHMYTEKPTVDVQGKLIVTDSFEFVGQVNSYNWTATADCNLEVYSLGMEEGSLDIYIYNANGELLDYDTYCYRGDGASVSEVKAGESYVICVVQRSVLSQYSVAIQYN